jgi:hypothetical protein
MATTVVTETTTATFWGESNGLKFWNVWNNHAAADDGGDADTTLTITMPGLRLIKGYAVSLMVDSGSGLGGRSFAVSANVLTITCATGLAANENCRFQALIIGT